MDIGHTTIIRCLIIFAIFGVISGALEPEGSGKAVTNQQNNITISTDLGLIKGIQKSNYFAFKGIPYTENAPISEYRFRESHVRNSSYQNGSYDATYYRPICPQLIALDGEDSEDCLYLNIWTPIIADWNASSELLPVMFWIHGGAFIQGSGSEYNGDTFMNQQNVVYVSINYRLGGFGFLSTESIYSETNGKSTGGMNGINDQIVALKWVQKYIHQFGGDADRVTIFGESAGSMSICVLLITPKASNLFDQAIMQSGSCLGGWSTDYNNPSIFNLSTTNGIITSQNALNIGGWNNYNLSSLRQIDVDQFKNIIPFMMLFPSIDSYLLTNQPYDLYTDPNKNTGINVDKLVIGFVSLDSPFADPWNLPSAVSKPPSNDHELFYYLKTYIHNVTQIELLMNKYYKIDDFGGDYALLWYSMHADNFIICAQINFAKLLENEKLMNNDDIYLYAFVGVEPPLYSIPHGGELSFLFNLSDHQRLSEKNMNVLWDQHLSHLVIDGWIDFAIYGDFKESIPEWISFGLNQSGMILSDNPQYQMQFALNYRDNVCPFWIDEVGWNVMSTFSAQSLPITNIPNTTLPQDDVDGNLISYISVSIAIGILFIHLF